MENGAGVAGVAAKTKDMLLALGYKVTDIGNYEGAQRQNTLLKFKSSKIAYKDTLSTDLKDKFTMVIEDGLMESFDYDVLMIIGVK